jgi:alpha-1,2-rhamnosyltransferase
MLRCVDAVICNSRSTEQDLRAYAEERRLPLPVSDFFHLGCDLPRAEPDGRRLADFFGEEPVFMCVGSIELRKNHTMLLDAFDQLWSAGARVRLLVAGKPAPEATSVVQRLTLHPERDSRLKFITDLSDAELVFAYSRAHAVVLPTLAEGFGLPLVEARAFGCPVIASDLPVFRELADDGVSLFAQGSCRALQDALAASAASTPTRVPAGRQVRSWADAARDLADRLDGMLNNKG